MASVQARHRRSCSAFSGRWTPAERTGTGCGCTCQPTYYLAIHHGSKLVREKVGRNRRVAERLRDKRSVELDEGAYQPLRRVRFAAWGTQWLSQLERKQSTIDSYRSTVAYATEAFGHAWVTKITPADIARLSAGLKQRGLSDSSRAKHLRVLGACFASAVEHGIAAQNPVRRLPRAERPRPTRKESAYFPQDELPLLFAEIPEGLYRTLFLVALKTGMRQGELLALTWGDVDLGSAAIRVRHSHTGGVTTTPKNHERRDVDLTPDLVELLGCWWGQCDKPADAALLFPGEGRSGHIAASTLVRRVLYPAMKRAGISREGPTGEKRTFHSLRHTYAKRALENGRQITWLSRHLGHSSLKVTSDVYGHWEAAERRREAQQMEGVFGV
jgi:integrase